MRYLSLFSGIEAATVAWHRLGWECVAVSEIEPFPCQLLHKHYGATRPRYMPDPDEILFDGYEATPSPKLLKESRRRRSAIDAVSNIPIDGVLPNLGDVSYVTEEDIKALGQIDLVVFGSPCQNLSVAGNREGLEGEQSGLFRTAMQIIEWAREHCGCRFALWENVPGAFSSNKGHDFTEVVKSMAGLRELETPKNRWGKEGAALGDLGLVEWCVLDAQWFGLAQRRKRVFAIADFGTWGGETTNIT